MDRQISEGQNITCSKFLILEDRKSVNPFQSNCPLHGTINNVKFLTKLNKYDPFIFVLIEGCYKITENGTQDFGSLIIINNLTHYQLKNEAYSYENIERKNGLQVCNCLCEDVSFIRKFVIEKIYSSSRIVFVLSSVSIVIWTAFLQRKE